MQILLCHKVSLHKWVVVSSPPQNFEQDFKGTGRRILYFELANTIKRWILFYFSVLSLRVSNLVNFIVIGIFINKNTYIIPRDAFVTYCSVKDTENVSRHFLLLKVHT